MALHIVLFEPEIPQNTGNIARTCAAIGASLHLVHPLGFSLDEKHLRRAGLDYWPLVSITEYRDVGDFFARHAGCEMRFFTTKAQKTYTDSIYPEEVFLVFGKESAGIDETILHDHRQMCLRIPMIDEARSLNLSNSVAIAAYEYMRQRGWPALQQVGKLHRLSWEA